MSEHILMIAGEPSGDLHGAGVVRALRQIAPQVKIFGIGGDRMRAAGQEQLYTTGQMAIIGFTEVIRHLPFLLRVTRDLEREIIRRRPVCAILIDYPGFNLRFARRLRKLDIPILYYIAPQVWAWGADRIPKMAKLITHMAVVFPFEEPLFRSAGLPTTFVGHPLLEVLQEELSREDFFERYHLSAHRKTLALLPGSRRQEIERLLPDMLATARLIRESVLDLQVVVAQSPDMPAEAYSEILAANPLGDVRTVRGATYSVMSYSDVCLVASGTATLETACFATPMAVVYRVSKATYAIGRMVVKLQNIALVNIVAGERIVPEFVQDAFVPVVVAEVLAKMLIDPANGTRISERLVTVRDRLGTPGASARVAEIAMRLAWPKKSA